MAVDVDGNKPDTLPGFHLVQRQTTPDSARAVFFDLQPPIDITKLVFIYELQFHLRTQQAGARILRGAWLDFVEAKKQHAGVACVV